MQDPTCLAQLARTLRPSSLQAVVERSHAAGDITASGFEIEDEVREFPMWQTANTPSLSWQSLFHGVSAAGYDLAEEPTNGLQLLLRNCG